MWGEALTHARPGSLPLPCADTVCAPLWDSERCAFAGMLTTSDIVDIMRVFYTPGSGAPASAALSDLTIAAWREFAGSKAGLSRGLSAPDFRKASTAAVRSATDDARAGGGGDVRMRGASPVNVPPARRTRARLIAIDPEDDLLTVSIKLSKHRIHHLPVLDVEQSAVIAILSHRHLLQFVAARFADARRLFDVPLYVLGVGSFEDVVVVPTSASVISVLNVLAERHISAVPLVNEAGQVVDVYCRDDVTFVAHDPTLMVLDAPVGEVRRAQVTMVSAHAHAPPYSPAHPAPADGPLRAPRYVRPDGQPAPRAGAVRGDGGAVRAPRVRGRAPAVHGRRLPFRRLRILLLPRAPRAAAGGRVERRAGGRGPVRGPGAGLRGVARRRDGVVKVRWVSDLGRTRCAPGPLHRGWTRWVDA